MFLKRGERGLLVGKTGSGKTQNGLFQTQNSVAGPVIIFDSKIDDVFFSLPQEFENAKGKIESESIELVESLESFTNYANKKRNELPDYTIVRPTSDEFVDPDLMDKYLQVAYMGFGPIFSYIDEITTFHKSGQALPGLVNLLTRGRSKGKTTLMGSQRPARISRFCMSETDRFYIHKLTDLRDRKTLAEVVPDFDRYDVPPPYHFWHYSHADHDEPVLFSPVPELKTDLSKIFKRKWL